MNKNIFISVKKLKMEQYKSGEEKQEGTKKLDRQKINRFLYYLIIALIICLSVWLIFFIRTESYECMNNPFIYAINNLQSSTGEDVVCRCNAPNNPRTLIITKYNMTYDNTFDTIS
jgi:predicted nucleic acid-binding Zn ribbon protein